MSDHWDAVCDYCFRVATNRNASEKWCDECEPQFEDAGGEKSQENLKVYIAGPYTDGAWEYNIRDVVKTADEVFEAGHTPFIPHTMTTLWALVSPKPKDEWLRFDLKWLDQCDCLVRIDGESEGGDVEVEYAKEIDIPIYYGVDAFLSEVV